MTGVQTCALPIYHYEAELFNSAKVVTLGNLGDIPALNVLSLGAENGYLDLGEDMGNIMYNLGDYTICAWVYIENENTTLNENGNFLWSFSNSADQATGQDGYMMASMKRTSNQITATNWSAEFGPSREENFAKGIWMHFAYVQSDTIGRLVIDGYDNFESDTDTVRITPKEALRKEGKAGTQFNWIGRPCFAADTYLANTYVHDFRLYNKAFTTEELEQMFDFDTLFDQLTEAMDAYVVLGVEDVEYDNIKIGVSEGKIIVYGAEDQPVTVYDMTGRSIAKTNGSEVSVSNGMYIVKVGTKCIKVMVK